MRKHSLAAGLIGIAFVAGCTLIGTKSEPTASPAQPKSSGQGPVRPSQPAGDSASPSGTTPPSPSVQPPSSGSTPTSGTAPIGTPPANPSGGTAAPTQGGSYVEERVPLAGGSAKLTAALAEPSTIWYRIVNVGAGSEKEKEKFLDSLLAEKHWPGSYDMVVVVFAAEANDIRFALGGVFRQKGVTVEAVYDLMKTQYFPKARQGDVDGALAGVVKAVNARMQ